MTISPKQLRILFIDDDKLEVINTMKDEGYDVDYWEDVESLERIVDGRYHVVFLDVRGIGSRYGGNGLDVLKYVATHNPSLSEILCVRHNMSILKEGYMYATQEEGGRSCDRGGVAADSVGMA